MKNLLALAFVYLAVGGLTGCANSNLANDFLCKAQIGSPCSTIDQADGGGDAAVRPVTETQEDTWLDFLSLRPLFGGKSSEQTVSMPDGGTAYETTRYRVPEVVGRLWIAPYLDENEILHESRFVHFVAVEAHWVEG